MKLSSRSDYLRKEIEELCIGYMEETGTDQMDPGLIFFYMAQRGYVFSELWDAVEGMGLVPEQWNEEEKEEKEEE